MSSSRPGGRTGAILHPDGSVDLVQSTWGTGHFAPCRSFPGSVWGRECIAPGTRWKDPGRRQVLKPEVLDLNAVVAGVDKMLRRLIPEDIELHSQPGADLLRVRVDPGQLEQVLLNLVVNARDAMPGGGRILISTANGNLAEATRGWSRGRSREPTSGCR